MGALLLLLLPAIPNSAQVTSRVDSQLADLASDEAETSFWAALALVDSSADGVDEALRAARTREEFRSSLRSRAALEFVIARRSGEPPPRGAPLESAPGVVLISIDTLRSDHLGCYGYQRPTSPNIDAEAARGARFQAAVAPASWTLPTHMSMLTSLYPSFHKLEKGGKVGSTRLDESEPTLGELLHQAGYASAGFVANPFLDASWGFGRGFDIYRREAADASLQSRRAALWIEWHRYLSGRGLAPVPFFLFVHYIDPHEPYAAPPPFQERFAPGYGGSLSARNRLVSRFLVDDFQSSEDFTYVVGLYDAEVSYVDDSLAAIFDALKRTGARENTLVIITSDHGEEFKDHGSMGHKQTLFDEMIVVPLVISWPARIAAGTIVERQVSLLDIAPTVRSAAGAGAVGLEQGINLLPHLAAPGSAAATPLPERSLFSELGPLGVKWEGRDYRRAVRTDGLKLIFTYDASGIFRRELYDLKTDPREKNNLWESLKARPDVVALERSLTGFIREGVAYNPGFREKNGLGLDEEMIEKLRSLGYVDD
jgi:arylsulfatase A-like enzyme